jgi:ABC-type tungstate transport system substrate-binding protein
MKRLPVLWAVLGLSAPALAAELVVVEDRGGVPGSCAVRFGRDVQEVFVGAT